jgi:hypothetical protein
MEVLLSLGIFPDKDATMYDPAMGTGVIVEVLKKNGYTNVLGDDIANGVDFLKSDKEVDHIVMNPPFSLFDEFVEKAKIVSKKKFVTIVKLGWLGAHGRNLRGTWKGMSDLYVFDRQVGFNLSPLSIVTGMLICGWGVYDPDWKEDFFRTIVVDIQKYYDDREKWQDYFKSNYGE